MVYKMARDRIDPIIIKEYVKRKGFSGTDGSIDYSQFFEPLILF